MNPRRPRDSIALIVVYLLLAILTTYPLVLNLSTHAPGDITDAPALAWNLWWIKYAFFNAQTNPLFTNYVFYPVGVDLVAYTLTVLNGLLALPIAFIANYVAANNAIVLFELTVSAYGMYLLAYDRLRRANMDDRAAIFAGFIYGLGSYHLNYISRGQPNIAANHWVPFYFLFLIRALESRQAVRYGAMAGLFFVLSAWTELTYAAFLGLGTIVYWIFRAREIEPRALLGQALALGAVTIVGIAPILADIVSEYQHYGDYLTVGLARSQIFSADLFGFVLPSSLNPVFGFLTRDLAYQTMNWTFAGIVPLVLAVGASIRFREARTWGWIALAFAILMLGPLLQIAGSITSLPLPYNLFFFVPLLKSNRYPFRLNSIFMLALTLAASYAFADLLVRGRNHVGWKYAMAAIVAFGFIEQLTIPMQLTDLRAPEIFNTIRNDPGDYTVLDLPLGWRNSARIQGDIDYRAHFWQSVHQKRLLDGNTSRNPQYKFQYFLQAPIINSIIALENGREVDEARRAQDRAMSAEVLRFFDIRYINVFRAKTKPQVLDYVLGIFPATEVYRDDERTVYRVAPEPRQQGTVEPSAETANLYFDDGWGRPQTADEGFGYRWATSSSARMWLPLTHASYKLKLHLLAPNKTQKIAVRLNGQLVQELNVTGVWNDYAIQIPASSTQDGLNEIVFSTDSSLLATAHQGNFMIGETGAVSPVDISATGAGFDAGRFGEVFVAGRSVIQSQRGYQLVAINSKTGGVDRFDRFDTFADSSESRRLAQFIAELPQGEIVAGVAVDEVSRELQQNAIDALKEIGVESDLRFQFRAGHAFIGVKGAQPGQALESVDARFPANVAVGRNVSSDRIAFALGPVTWERVK